MFTFTNAINNYKDLQVCNYLTSRKYYNNKNYDRRPRVISFTYNYLSPSSVIIFFNIRNSIEELGTINFFVKLTVSISPVIVFACYYISACLAHYLYYFYYEGRSNSKRILFYKYSIIFFSVLVYIFTIFDLNFNIITDDKLSFMLYKRKFINTFYLVGLVLLFYIIYKFYFILIKDKNDFETLDSSNDQLDVYLKNEAYYLTKRHTIAVFFFLLEFGPNNIFMLLKYNFYDENDFEFSYYFNLASFSLISLSATISVLIQLLDPFVRHFIFKSLGIMSSTNDDILLKEKFVELQEHEEIKENEERNSVVIEMHEFKEETKLKKNQTLTDSNMILKVLNDNKDVTVSKHFTSSFVNMHPPLLKFNDSRRPSDKNNNEDDKHSQNSEMIKYNTSNATHLLTPRPVYQRRSNIFDKQGDKLFELMNVNFSNKNTIYRMIGISILLNEDRKYDIDVNYRKKFISPLPWNENNLYLERNECKEYKQENLPDWVSIKYNEKLKNFKLKIKKYASLVFHHIRTIDKVSIDDCIKSLDPIINLEKINDSAGSGGRSTSSIHFTWDKKMLIKTIEKHEKKLFVNKLLKDYHKRMRDTKSLLCRIYGLFRIAIADQYKFYVVLMKNMCYLPLETKVLTFDLKGSSVDRDCISKDDRLSNMEKDNLISKYRNQILKDNDLRFLELPINLNQSDSKNLTQNVENDSYFLEKNNITDYSLLIAIHKFKPDDYRKNLNNLGVMKSNDDKYLFSFSIIDFLTVK